ncbi:MAG: PAS domain S-box protein [Sulfuritalea sp.]|nr:PAS domain S-box protein [Sulfuritalea sp.]
MNLNAFPLKQSLKVRVTLLTLIIFAIGIWSMTIYSNQTLRADMKEVLGKQQFLTVSNLANEMNHEFNDRYNALATVARGFDQAILDDPAASEKILKARPVLQSLFNDGVIAYRMDGVAIAEIPGSAKRIGLDYSNTDYLLSVFKAGKPAIGKPYISGNKQLPEFVMAVPIRDIRNNIIGALSGVIDLGKPNFLDRITHASAGNAGGFMLVARQPRLIVTATDKRHVMQPIPPFDDDSLQSRFVQGYEGSGVTTNPFGEEILTATMNIPAADWFLATSLPTSVAYAPIAIMQKRMLLAAIFLTLLIGVLTWLMLNRQLSPLLSTVDELGKLSDTNLPATPLPVTRQDEVGELIGGFNRLLHILGNREKVLSESEERYRSLFKLSPDAMFVHRDDIILFANDAAAKLFQTGSPEKLIGLDWHKLIAEADWPITENRVAALQSGVTHYMPPLERRHVSCDGQVISVESTGTRIIFNGEPAVLSVIRDITIRMQMEQKRLKETQQQRDTLVREVHHRIKNNLQSVAGLLQRELGQFNELNPRLETAISQVHAIAEVHGLQSSNPDEAVRLCDSLISICKIAADLSLRPVLFQIENEHTGFRPVRIENSEAVPVALVLNELVLNAVKHSPPNSAAPTVSLSTVDGSAHLLIRNALAATPDFDILTGKNLGTGLRLVNSLLPKQGAELVYEIDTEGFMLTRLRLTAPVVELANMTELGAV